MECNIGEHYQVHKGEVSRTVTLPISLLSPFIVKIFVCVNNVKLNPVWWEFLHTSKLLFPVDLIERKSQTFLIRKFSSRLNTNLLEIIFNFSHLWLGNSSFRATQL